MIRHIFKMISSQLGGNSWILAELCVVFIVLWYLVDFFLMQGVLVNRPVGFQLDRVYKVNLSLKPSNSPSFIRYEEGSGEPLQNIRRIMDRLQAHPDVEAVCLSYFSLPYTFSNITPMYQHDSIRVMTRRYMVSPEYFRVFEIRPLSGGSPEELAGKLKEDGGLFSASVGEKLFGHTNVIGEQIYLPDDSVPIRIVELTENVRNTDYDTDFIYSEFSLLDDRAIAERNITEEKMTWLQICFRVRPGSNEEGFAGRFMKEMRPALKVGNFWVSDVEPYTEIRTSLLDRLEKTRNLRLFTTLSAFLLVNVFLAVVGTFWFRVNRRRSELGLRMAMGSSRASIRWLMIGESFLLLMLAAVPALLVCLNLAWMEIFSTEVMPLTAGRFLGVSLLTLALLASIIFLATWYPSYKASRLEPADALHYE